jgi:biopolymer transport protein TolR
MMQAEINVTPLVDVCLVLLIIFMVMLPTMINGVPVDLPETRHSDAVKDTPLPITVKSDTTVYVGTAIVHREALASELQRQHDAAPSRGVAVRGDKRVAYGEVVSVLDACRKAGWDDVKLVSLATTPAAPGAAGWPR